uniref:Uncharacterized protein n=1 Tax=Fagus sylvatica TaxID=28930 RepID=A0A2N9HW59_FAGSY
MKVMAFWMWLEAQGFKEVVSKISVYDDKFLAMGGVSKLVLVIKMEIELEKIRAKRQWSVGKDCLGSHPEGFEKMEQEGEGSSVTVRTNLNPFAKEWNPCNRACT